MGVQKTAKSARVFRFGVFEVDAATGELRKQGLRIRLQEQPSQILLMLLGRAGEVVSREEICRQLWPPDTFVVFDQSLGTALRKLRQALCDDAESPRYIETIPKHGFRFIAPIVRISAMAQGLTFRANEPPAPRINGDPEIVRGRQSISSQPIRSSILPPPNWCFEHSSFSISPDGTRLAFAAVGPDGNDKLWIRALSSSNPQQINGTEGALLPFWSPDNRRIGFFAAGKLNTVDLDSGAVQILCEAPFGRCGGAWSRSGSIVFSPSVNGPLYRISDIGGVPVSITQMARSGPGRRHMWPFFLPDGSHFLYSESSGPVDPGGESIYVSSLDGSSPKLVCSRISANVVYADGYLLYGRDHTLWANLFDLTRLELDGTATPLTSQELDLERSFSHAEFSVSQNGMLIFQSLSDYKAKLAWFDINGKELAQGGEAGYRDPRLSPNGRLLAVSSDDARNGKFFIRVYDLARGVSARLTDGGTDGSPAWSRDGKTIAYSAHDALKEVAADGSSPPHILLEGGYYLGHLDWSPDGYLVFTDFSAGFPSLKIYSAVDKRVVSFAIGAEARFSPDGKWLAYVGPLTVPDSDAIFIAPFPGPGERIRISSSSAAQPNWARDGRHLFL